MSLSVPSLPTDNLYKFISLTGFFIAVVSFGFLEYRISQQAELDAGIRVGKEALDILLDEMSIVEKDVEQLEKNSLLIEKIDSEKEKKWKTEKIAEKLNVIKEDMKYIKNRRRENFRDIIKLREKSEKAENYYQRTERLRPPILVIGYLGMFLATWGFYLWYYRLQKYQDILVYRQAMEYKKESETNTDDSST